MHSVSRWRSRLLSAGMSLAINAAIFGILVGVLAAPPKPAETLIAVELDHSAVVSARYQPPQLVTSAMPSAPTPVAEGKSGPRPRPVSPVLPTIVAPPNVASPSGVASHERTSHNLPAPRLSYPFGAGRPGPAPRATGGPVAGGTGPGIGGGTTGRGPGVPSVADSGAGTTLARGGGSGTGAPPSAPISAVEGHRSEVGKSDPPPRPTAPKGESRGVQPAKQPQPAYPSDARDDGVEGTVVLIAVVGTDGKVTEVRVEKGSGDRRLDRAAEKGVRRWTYKPALKDGAPVKANVRVRVEFRLE